MIQLQTLGALDLKGPDGREIRRILAQPKRFALLTYLALAESKGFRRRDTILALFWPELDQERGRNALRQAIWFLRQSLGEGVLVGRGEEELGVSEHGLRCDAVDFERLHVAGRMADALALYRGSFLDGFFPSDSSPELERWIDNERERLRRRAAAVAWALADAYASVEDRAGAVELGRRAVALLPDDEPAVRRLIRLLDASGNRVGAIRVYEDFASRLAGDLELSPAPETSALIEAVRARETGSVVRSAPPTGPATTRAEMGGQPVNLFETPPSPARSRILSRTNLAVLGVLLAVAVAGAAVWWPDPPPRLDPNLVAVAPFRVGGSEESLGYLREGMVDLLAAALTGEGGLRSLDPGAVLHAWRQSITSPAGDLAPDAAISLAQRLGAGRLIRGGVVGDLHHLVLTASVYTVSDGRIRARGRVEGPVEKLASLVDGLTAQLLAGEAGQSEHRLVGLTSLPALRAYLDGRAAYRRGRLKEAELAYARALQLDSAFALAALGLVFLGEWGLVIDVEPAARLAWAARHRLSTHDRAILMAHVGPNYPSSSTLGEFLEAREAAVRVAPDRAEVWSWLGDFYFHYGALLGLDDPLQRAKAAFKRAIAIDSLAGMPPMSVEALTHLIAIAFEERDISEARRLIGVLSANDSAGKAPDAYRWWLAQAQGDSAELRTLRDGMSALSDGTLTRIIFTAQEYAVGVSDAVRALEVIEQSLVTGEDRNERLFALGHHLALNLGRPSQARAALSRMREPIFIPHLDLYSAVVDYLFWSGDTASAKAAASRLAALMATPMPSEPAARAVRYVDICVLGLWWVGRGQFDRAAQALQRLGDALPTGTLLFTQDDKTLCTSMLESSLATAQSRPDARTLVTRLDSILRRGPSSNWRTEATLLLARLHEEGGDTAAALGAIRRRPTDGPSYLSSFLREEGRLAAAVGDTVGAIRANRRYLTLRADPEPELLPEAHLVREELARLEGVALAH